jgi:hypothetical protein
VRFRTIYHFVTAQREESTIKNFDGCDGFFGRREKTFSQDESPRQVFQYGAGTVIKVFSLPIFV